MTARQLRGRLSGIATELHDIANHPNIELFGGTWNKQSLVEAELLIKETADSMSARRGEGEKDDGENTSPGVGNKEKHGTDETQGGPNSHS